MSFKRHILPILYIEGPSARKLKGLLEKWGRWLKKVRTFFMSN